MLVLRRKEGQWVEVTHRSGDVLRIRVCNIRARYPGQADLAFDDTPRNFIVERPDRAVRPDHTPQAAIEGPTPEAATS